MKEDFRSCSAGVTSVLSFIFSLNAIDSV